MKRIFDEVSLKASKQTTKAYSTSFSLGIRFLNKEIRGPIYSIYGFVRFADEIVDTFHDYDKRKLLEEFRANTYLAIERGISLNPILNSFQAVVNKYKIPMNLVDTFLNSMEMDLESQEYNRETYDKYILGSAEVVGLMCLNVFVKGDRKLYEDLKDNAMKLGAAFQKINFLKQQICPIRLTRYRKFVGEYVLKIDCVRVHVHSMMVSARLQLEALKNTSLMKQ